MAHPRLLTNRRQRGVAGIGLTALVAATAYCGGSAFEAAPGDGTDPDAQAIDGAHAEDASAALDTSTAADSTIDSPNETGVTGDGAPSDTSSQDAPILDAAIPDAAVSCSAPPAGSLFCADFDHVAKPGDTWSVPLAFGNGMNGFDGVAFISAPYGYGASIPPSLAAAGASLSLTGITSTATRLEYNFAAYVKQIDTINEATITAARLAVGSSGGHDLLIDLLLDHNGLRVHQSAAEADGAPSSQDTTLTSAVTLNTWFHFRIELERGTAPAIRVYIDNVKKAEVTPITSKIQGSSVEIDLGLIFVESPTSAASITFDDVLLRGI